MHVSLPDPGRYPAPFDPAGEPYSMLCRSWGGFRSPRVGGRLHGQAHLHRSPQSGTGVIANRLIETAGLKEGDVKAQGLDLSVSAGVGSPACALTTLTYEKKAELVKVHPAAADIDVALAEKTDPIPVHPGSERALNSLGG